MTSRTTVEDADVKSVDRCTRYSFIYRVLSTELTFRLKFLLFYVDIQSQVFSNQVGSSAILETAPIQLPVLCVFDSQRTRSWPGKTRSREEYINQGH